MVLSLLKKYQKKKKKKKNIRLPTWRRETARDTVTMATPKTLSHSWSFTFRTVGRLFLIQMTRHRKPSLNSRR